MRKNFYLLKLFTVVLTVTFTTQLKAQFNADAYYTLSMTSSVAISPMSTYGMFGNDIAVGSKVYFASNATSTVFGGKGDGIYPVNETSYSDSAMNYFWKLQQQGTATSDTFIIVSSMNNWMMQTYSLGDVYTKGTSDNGGHKWKITVSGGGYKLMEAKTGGYIMDTYRDRVANNQGYPVWNNTTTEASGTVVTITQTVPFKNALTSLVATVPDVKALGTSTVDATTNLNNDSAAATAALANASAYSVYSEYQALKTSIAAYINGLKTPQTIAIADPGAKANGDADFDLTLSEAGSGTGAVTYEVVSGTAATVTSSGTVHIKSGGTVTIRATKAADATYGSTTDDITINIASGVSFDAGAYYTIRTISSTAVLPVIDFAMFGADIAVSDTVYSAANSASHTYGLKNDGIYPVNKVSFVDTTKAMFWSFAEQGGGTGIYKIQNLGTSLYINNWSTGADMYMGASSGNSNWTVYAAGVKNGYKLKENVSARYITSNLRDVDGGKLAANGGRGYLITDTTKSSANAATVIVVKTVVAKNSLIILLDSAIYTRNNYSSTTEATIALDNAISASQTALDNASANSVYDEFLTLAAAYTAYKNNVVTETPKSLASSNVTLYPNPVSKGFVKVNVPAGGGKIVVTSVSGAVILSKSIQGTVTEVDMNTLAPGLYLFKVTTPAGMITKKVIKQ